MAEETCESCGYFRSGEKDASAEFKESFARELGCSPQGIILKLNDSKCFVEPKPNARFPHDIACEKYKPK